MARYLKPRKRAETSNMSNVMSNTFSIRGLSPTPIWPDSLPGGISKFPCASVLKRVSEQKLSYENEFDLHENELTDEMFS